MISTKLDSNKSKKLQDAIATAVVQAVKAYYGAEEQQVVVKITSGNLSTGQLDPSGVQVGVKLLMDVYPIEPNPNS
jgi:hypothetical protein